MEWLVEWLKVIAPVIAVLALWWRIASTMATKTDISELRQELNAGISGIRQELHAGLSGLRHEFKADLLELRREQKDDMLEMKADLRKDIRELRELLFMHVSDHEKHGMHGPED